MGCQPNARWNPPLLWWGKALRCRSNRRDWERDGSNLQVNPVQISPPLKGQKDYQSWRRRRTFWAQFKLSWAALGGKKKGYPHLMCVWVVVKVIFWQFLTQRKHFIKIVSCVCHMNEVTAVRGWMEDGWGWRACPGPAVGCVFKKLMLLSQGVYLSLIWLWSFHSLRGRLMVNNERRWCPDKAQGHRD